MSLTKVSYAMIQGAPVNVLDYGAKCDGITDDTVAVQAAVTYAIANNLGVYVPGLCLLTASVNIDRQVDGAAFDDYFVISSNGSGGFTVDTAIPMFSTTIAFSTDPVSQLVRFENVIFQSSNSSLAAYVLDNAKFLRTSFESCTFAKIKLLTAPTVYTQSIYLIGCNIRRFSGTFFNSGSYTYDFKMVNCIVEAGGGTALRWHNAIGCSVVSSCIEGMSGTAIAYNGASGIDITGSYFEGNGLDIDGTDGGTSSSNAYGVCLNGNYFSHPNATYSIVWGASFNCISIGNYHQYNMHNQTSATSDVMVDDFAQGSLCATTITRVAGNYSDRFIGTYHGFTAGQTANFYYSKVGNTVTVNIPTTSGTSNSTSFYVSGVSSNIIPTRQQDCICRVKDNGTDSFGIAIVDTSGNISFGVGSAGNSFTASGTKSTENCTITYALD